MKKFISLIMLLTIVTSSFGCSNQPTSQNKTEANSIINENSESTLNNVEIQNTKHITFSTNYEIVECYMGYFIATTNDGRLYGMLDSNGNTVIDFIYDSLTFGSNKSQRRENVIYASTENGKGIIDFKGNIVIPFKYSEIKEYTEYCDYTFARSQNGICLISENLEETELDISVVRGELIFIYPLGNSYFEARSTSEDTIYNLSGETLASYTGLPILSKRVSEKYTGIQETIYDNNTYTTKMSFYDNDFNLCCTIEDSDLTTKSFAIKEYVDEDKGIAELNNGEKVLIEYASGNITKDFDPNIINDKTISLEHKSDTYRVYDSDGNDLFNERFYNAKEFDNEYVLLENLDGQEALINMYGEVMYDFGTISENSIFDYVKEQEFFNKEMYCAVVNNGNNYTVYAYIN